MSSDIAEVKIGADIGGAVAGINQVKASLESLSASTREMARATSARSATTRADLKAHTDALVATFQAEQSLAAGAKASAGAMAGLGLNTQYARRELMTLGREVMTGNMTRVPVTFGSLLSHSNLLAAAFSPTGMLVLGVAATAAAMGYMAVKGEEADRAFAKLTAHMAGMGTGGLFSDLGLKDLIGQLAALPGMTQASADATVSALADLRNVGQDTFREIALTVNDFAAATGQKAPAAARILASALADPARGARKLHDELGILTAQQILHIEAMDREGQHLEAQKELLAAVQARVKGLADNALTPLQKATEGLENAWVKLKGSLGDDGSENKVIADLASLERGITSLIEKLTGSGMATALANLGSALRYGPMLAPTMAAYDAMFGGKGKGAAGQSSGGKIGSGAAAPETISPAQADVDKQVLLAQSLKGPTNEIVKMREELVGLKRAKAEATDPADVKDLDAAIATLNGKIAKAQLALGAAGRKAAEEARRVANEQIDMQSKLSAVSIGTAEAVLSAKLKEKLISQQDYDLQKMALELQKNQAEQKGVSGKLALGGSAPQVQALKNQLAVLQAQAAATSEKGGVTQGADAMASSDAAMKESFASREQLARGDLATQKEIATEYWEWTKQRYGAYPEIVAQAYTRIEVLDKDLAEKQKKDADKAVKAQEKATKDAQKAWEGAFAPIGNAFANMAKGVAMGTETLRKGLANIWSSILGEFVNMIASMMVKWAALEAWKLATTQAGSAARMALDAQTSLAAIVKAKLTAMGLISASAGTGGAAAAASTAAIPIVGPAMAPAAGAGMAAYIMGFLGMASAAGGFDIPSGVNPVTQLHAREMVLPANLADSVRNMSGGGGGDTHFHVHAMDTAGVKAFLMKHGPALAQVARAQVRAATSSSAYSPMYPS